MTVREGIQKLLEFDNLNSPLMVQVVHRGECNQTLYVQSAEVRFVKTLTGILCIEESELTNRG